MTRIDAHAHFAPAPYLARIQARAGGKLPIPPWSLEDSLAMMDKYQIDASVLSVSPPGAFMGDMPEAIELARMVNETAANIVAAQPAKFAVLACLPLPSLDAALQELTHALDVLKLDGVAVFTHYGENYLGNEKFAPLLEELNKRSAYVFVHPTLPVHATPLAKYPTWLYEFPFETTRCITDLLYSGAFERYKNIRFQFAHMGGTVPFLAGRIASLPLRSPPGSEFAINTPEGPLTYLQRLYYDTGLSNTASSIEATRNISSFDHIVFGTDWPYAELPAGRDPAPELSYLKEDRNQLECKNILALVPRFNAALQKENSQ